VTSAFISDSCRSSWTFQKFLIHWRSRLALRPSSYWKILTPSSIGVASSHLKKEHDLSCFFFDGMKSISWQFAKRKTIEMHAEDPTRNSLATANPLRTCHMTFTLSHNWVTTWWQPSIRSNRKTESIFIHNFVNHPKICRQILFQLKNLSKMNWQFWSILIT